MKVPGYDSMPDLGEIRVYQRADFQSGSRVLKRCSEPFLIYIYGLQCDAKKLLKKLKF